MGVMCQGLALIPYSAWLSACQSQPVHGFDISDHDYGCCGSCLKHSLPNFQYDVYDGSMGLGCESADLCGADTHTPVLHRAIEGLDYRLTSLGFWQAR